MSFDSATFPSFPMIHGVSKAISDPVQVSSNGTYEYRVRRNRWERLSWSIPTQTMTVAQKDAIRKFLLQRNHALNSFRFIDPEQSTLTSAKMSWNSGTYWNLAVPLDANTAGTHPIFNPILGELTVTVNGSPSTLNSFTVLNGVPVVSITGTTGSENVRISGNLYYTVRLATDLSYALYALDCSNKPLGYQVSSIELIEVYGEY